MTRDEQNEDYHPIYQMAMDIIEQGWIDAGTTREELNQKRQVSDILANLMADGKSVDEIEAEWEGKSNTRILEKYTLIAFPH